VLRRVAVVVLVLAAASACGDDGSSSSLDDRVRDVLSLPSSAAVLCPVVREVEAGDLATCVVTHDDGREVEVDLEFEEDGGITVVAEVER
jgi:hypothetical protein